MDYRFILLLPVFLTFVVESHAKRPFTIEYNNFTCRLLMPSEAHEFSCFLPIKRITPTLSVRFNLKEPMTAFNLLFDFSLMRKDNSIMNVARHKIDGCKFLSSLSGNSIFSQIYSHIQKVSDIPKKCPVPANKVFQIRNYTVLDSDYPAVVPEISHYFVLKIEKKGKIIADLYLAGLVSYK